MRNNMVNDKGVNNDIRADWFFQNKGFTVTASEWKLPVCWVDVWGRNASWALRAYAWEARVSGRFGLYPGDSQVIQVSIHAPSVPVLYHS